MLNDFVLIVECNQTMVTLPGRSGELDNAMVFNALYQLGKLGIAFCTTAMFTAIQMTLKLITAATVDFAQKAGKF